MVRSSSFRPVRATRSLATAYSFGSSLHGALGVEDYADGEEYMVSSPVLAEVDVAFCGWGHSLYLKREEEASGRRQLYITGKPHEFQSLLRMNRLPTAVATALSWFHKFGGGGSNEEDGLEKSFQSLIPERIQFEGIEVSDICAASAGLTAIVSTTGELYTFGVNNFGQCGVGENSNNVWEPTKVLGLHSENSEPVPERSLNQGRKEEMAKLGDEGRIVSVGLGLQHGAAVNDLGDVYSWGKGERGQLGLWPEGGNTCYASKVRLERGRGRDKRVKIEKVECGINHTAALSSCRRAVYVWGKFMGPAEVEVLGVDEADETEAVEEEGRATDAFFSHKFEFEQDIKNMKR